MIPKALWRSIVDHVGASKFVRKVFFVKNQSKAMFRQLVDGFSTSFRRLFDEFSTIVRRLFDDSSTSFRRIFDETPGRKKRKRLP